LGFGLTGAGLARGVVGGVVVVVDGVIVVDG
jgi:hypothetical protein